jgi:hypothetical protein
VVKKMVHVGADDLDIKPSSHVATPSRQSDLGLSRCVQGLLGQLISKDSVDGVNCHGIC